MTTASTALSLETVLAAAIVNAASLSARRIKVNCAANNLAMTTASTALSLETVLAAAIVNAASLSARRIKVNCVSGLNSFSGMKANNSVASLVGLPVCTEYSFAKIVNSFKQPPQGRGRSGGALSSTCGAVEEIFKIAAIIPGLVLVGVAVGFVFIGIETIVEESE